MRAPRFNTQAVDLAGFEAWLRGQLVGPAYAAVVTVVLQMIRALFEQNLLLRMRLAGRRPKPPSERFAVIERQLSFAFAVPTNDVTPTPAPAQSTAPDDEAEKKPRAKPTPRAPLPKHLARIEVPNNVPNAERFCAPCNVPMTRMCVRRVETIEVIPGRVVVHWYLSGQPRSV